MSVRVAPPPPPLPSPTGRCTLSSPSALLCCPHRFRRRTITARPTTTRVPQIPITAAMTGVIVAPLEVGSPSDRIPPPPAVGAAVVGVAVVGVAVGVAVDGVAVDGVAVDGVAVEGATDGVAVVGVSVGAGVDGDALGASVGATVGAGEGESVEGGVLYTLNNTTTVAIALMITTQTSAQHTRGLQPPTCGVSCIPSPHATPCKSRVPHIDSGVHILYTSANCVGIEGATPCSQVITQCHACTSADRDTEAPLGVGI